MAPSDASIDALWADRPQISAVYGQAVVVVVQRSLQREMAQIFLGTTRSLLGVEMISSPSPARKRCSHKPLAPDYLYSASLAICSCSCASSCDLTARFLNV
jgi:hypothetical protein